MCPQITPQTHLTIILHFVCLLSHAHRKIQQSARGSFLVIIAARDLLRGRLSDKHCGLATVGESGLAHFVFSGVSKQTRDYLICGNFCSPWRLWERRPRGTASRKVCVVPCIVWYALWGWLVQADEIPTLHASEKSRALYLHLHHAHACRRHRVHLLLCAQCASVHMR